MNTGTNIFSIIPIKVGTLCLFLMAPNQSVAQTLSDTPTPKPQIQEQIHNIMATNEQTITMPIQEFENNSTRKIVHRLLTQIALYDQNPTEEQGTIYTAPDGQNSVLINIHLDNQTGTCRFKVRCNKAGILFCLEGSMVFSGTNATAHLASYMIEGKTAYATQEAPLSLAEKLLVIIQKLPLPPAQQTNTIRR